MKSSRRRFFQKFPDCCHLDMLAAGHRQASAMPRLVPTGTVLFITTIFEPAGPAAGP